MDLFLLLFFFLLFLFLLREDWQVLQDVSSLLWVGDNSENFLQFVLLQVSLCQVLQVSLGDLYLGVNEELVVLLVQGDLILQVTGNSVNLELFKNELLL